MSLCAVLMLMGQSACVFVRCFEVHESVLRCLCVLCWFWCRGFQVSFCAVLLLVSQSSGVYVCCFDAGVAVPVYRLFSIMFKRSFTISAVSVS